ncbi:transmembrane protein, putative [Bodo saltans]|uniref:Transmembrane protein, putative n=1 Tax=Bodo saltans TaxID=75058 RepID=A0A0S4JSK1_BODSA|nr:transmembrane protein, putative [Bodo saltans]|eukprot:CUG93219.1 transmembrane protein, putative [Bodo saltans]
MRKAFENKELFGSVTKGQQMVPLSKPRAHSVAAEHPTTTQQWKQQRDHRSKRSLLCHGNPSKCAVEAAWALWFVVWSGIMTVIMATNLGGIWGDVELMLLGVGLGVATFLVPMCCKRVVIDNVLPIIFGVRLSVSERQYALQHFTADLWTMTVGVTTLSFGLNWLMTPYFYDVLHMRYGFHVSWTYDRTPLFLYWITIAYFSSYSVLGAMLYRWAAWCQPEEDEEKEETRKKDQSVSSKSSVTNTTTTTTHHRLLPWYHPKAFVVRIFASFLLAFLETLLMANPLIDHLFCYDDYILTITFGSACYGVLPWYHPKAFVVRIFASFLLAFLETLLMANPLIDHLFCYDDYILTITFGSACYGVSFVFAMWSWTSSVPEEVDVRGCGGVAATKEGAGILRSASGGGAWHSFMCSVAATILTTLCLVWIRAHVAPLVTTVVDNSPAYGGCLLLSSAASR